MAAGNFTVLNLAKKKIGNGTIKLGVDTFKAALTTSTQALAATFTGTSTDARYADLTAETTGTGYTAGGVTMTTVTWNQATGTITFDADDVSWATLTSTFKYLVIYDNTATNKDILGFVDLNTSGSITSTAANYTVVFNASGLFTLA